MYTKREFFHKPMIRDITNGRTQILGTNIDDLVMMIVESEEDNYLLIEEGVLFEEDPRKWLKHGREVKLRRFRSLEKMVDARLDPVQLREKAFSELKRDYCGYTFLPVSGKDQRKRKVHLVDCVEGSRIYSYVVNSIASIDIRPYDDAKRTSKDGASLIVNVPSRQPKQGRYKFKMFSAPVVDSRDKYGISLRLATDHSCEHKRYQIRYRYETDKESSNIFTFCPHEIAAYLAIIDHYWLNDKNITPLQMSQFALPTQFTADFDRRLRTQVITQYTTKNGRQKRRTLNRAEMEKLYWRFVGLYGHDRTFFATEKLRDYNW